MAKFTLTIEEDLNFDLIGICSHQSDYRICWALNNSLGWNLVKSIEPFMFSGKKGTIISSHSLYEWIDEEENLAYYLIQNKNDGKFLIPEKSQVDFFLIIREAGMINMESVLNKIKEIQGVLVAYIFDPYELKSAGRFIF